MRFGGEQSSLLSRLTFPEAREKRYVSRGIGHQFLPRAADSRLYCPPRSEWRGAEYLSLRRGDPLVPAERSLALLAHSHGPDIAALMRAGAHARAHARDLPRARVSSRIQIERANANERE